MPHTIFECIQNSDIKQINHLIENNPNIVHRTDKCYGRSTLMEAIVLNNADLVKIFVQNGTDVNYQDQNGFSALHFTAQENLPEIAEFLLKCGANPEIKDNHGNTALLTAVVNYRNQGDLINLLKKYGASIHTENKSGVSPYKLAQRIGNDDIKQHFSE